MKKFSRLEKLNKLNKLSKLRDDLYNLNINFLKLVRERKKIVSQIFHEKRKSQIDHFDYLREHVLFKKMQSDLKKLSVQELLSFSLLIESHAVNQKESEYPRWSMKTHINLDEKQINKKKIKFCIEENSCDFEILLLINPILIKYARKSWVKYLPLKDDYSRIILK